MKINEDPLMSTVLAASSPMVRPYHDAFEAGVDYAKQQMDDLRSRFGNPSIKTDPWYFSHAVRIYVKQMLTQNGLQVEDYRLDNLPFSGLRFLSNGWEWRTRKSFKNGMPRLAQTKPIRAFCQAMLPDEFTRMGVQDLLSRRHLWLLWHTTPANDEYLGFSVVYLLEENSANPTVLGKIDYFAKSELFRSPETLEQDMATVGDMEFADAEFSGDLEMELESENTENAEEENTDDNGKAI